MSSQPHFDILAALVAHLEAVPGIWPIYGYNKQDEAGADQALLPAADKKFVHFYAPLGADSFRIGAHRRSRIRIDDRFQIDVYDKIGGGLENIVKMGDLISRHFYPIANSRLTLTSGAQKVNIVELPTMSRPAVDGSRIRLQIDVRFYSYVLPG